MHIKACAGQHQTVKTAYRTGAYNSDPYLFRFTHPGNSPSWQLFSINTQYPIQASAELGQRQPGVQGPIEFTVTHHKQRWQMECLITLNNAPIFSGVNPAHTLDRQIKTGQRLPGPATTGTPDAGKNDERGSRQRQQTLINIEVSQFQFVHKRLPEDGRTLSVPTGLLVNSSLNRVRPGLYRHRICPSKIAIGPCRRD
jgi:hypothetical protein